MSDPPDYSYLDPPEPWDEQPEEEDPDAMRCEDCGDPAKDICGCGMALCGWCFARHKEACDP